MSLHYSSVSSYFALMKKKLISLAYLLCFSFIVNAQDTIGGLGKLRIDMPENDFLQMMQQNYYEGPVSLKKQEELTKTEDRKLYQCMFDVINEYFVYYYRCEKSSLYFIKSFSIDDGVELANTYVIFYDSSLIYITTDFTDSLQQSLEAKYGRMKPEIHLGSTPCKDINGKNNEPPMKIIPLLEKENLYDIRLDMKYRNDSVVAMAMLRVFYNENCNEKREQLIRIYDKKGFLDFSQCH